MSGRHFSDKCISGITSVFHSGACPDSGIDSPVIFIFDRLCRKATVPSGKYAQPLSMTIKRDGH